MQNLFAAVLLLGGLAACQSGPPAAKPPPASRLAPPRAVAAPAESPAQVAVRFFTWYKNHPEVNRQDLLENDQNNYLPEGQPSDTTLFMAVSPGKVRAYLDGLTGSRCVSVSYVDGLRRHIRQWGDSLQAHRQYEGVVMGFDFDLVMNSQDFEEELNRIGQVPKLVRYPAPGRAVVTADYGTPGGTLPWRKNFHLRRYPTGWLIDSIN